MIQLLTGLLASAFHVIAGPDHLAAVTPLAIERKNKAWHVGFAWGLGHVTGMLLIGILFLLFREFIPVETISHYSEQIVGVVLIIIGLWALYKVYRPTRLRHAHPHMHENPEPYIHSHTHAHINETGHVHGHARTSKQSNFAAFSVGTLHGFAGISHLLLILPTLAFPTTFQSVLYLTGFGAGTIIAMIAYAFLLGVITVKTSTSLQGKVFNFLRIGGGLFAIIIGIFWIIQTI